MWDCVSILIDLIYGLPHQTNDSFAETLDTVVGMSPDRLSIFNYAHMPDRFRSQRHIKEQDLPSPAQKLAIQQQTITKLSEAGYQYIGMDHFAKPTDELSQAQITGQLHRNFQGYTTHSDCDLVAMGVSAISQIGDLYYQNSHDLKTYSDLIEEKQCAIIRGVSLTADDRIRRDLITQLICHFSLDIADFERKHELVFNQYFKDEVTELQRLATDKLLSFDEDKIQISAAGRILVRRICMVFDAYMDQAKLKQSFSRII